MKHSNLCVGIDLGTTNSVIAIKSVADPELNTPVVEVERYTDVNSRGGTTVDRRALLPSCVYYLDNKDGTYNPIVGDFAKKQAPIMPFAVATSVKKNMGEPALNIPGWNRDYPDQTPEEVSAQVLRHMLYVVREFYAEEDLCDAVITVPASFNLAQREATLRAAELAGLDVRDENGAYRDDVLLSEPEAVIYDVLNRVQNGRLSLPIDFTDDKNVLVFDIGGGTLDITLHKIMRTSDGTGSFQIRPLATNRFSTVAGERFDEILAGYLYRKSLDEFRREDELIAQRLEKSRQDMIPFTAFAEEIKRKASDQYRVRKRMQRPLKPDHEFAYGGMLPSGYRTENSITLEEFEEVLDPLLGKQYSYDDYKKFDSLQDDDNIIYAVLDVLNKASKKLDTEDVQVDAVIMNGGMSRLYLIEDRLEEFFGQKPIAVSDPDKSVAQGAAVYHYYLHQDDTARQRSRLFWEAQAGLETGEEAPQQPQEEQRETGIISEGSILNEAIYLGLKGGANKLLGDAGLELPFESEPMPGFSVVARQRNLRIPIMQKTAKQGFRTIASGDITFKKPPLKETPVAFQYQLRKNGTLTMRAWTYSGQDCSNVIEEGSVTLEFGSAGLELNMRTRGRMALPPIGAELVVVNELSAFKNQVDQLRKNRNPNKRRSITKDLAARAQRMAYCGNPQEFARKSVELLHDNSIPQLFVNFLPAARVMARHWTDQERRELASICYTAIQGLLANWPVSGDLNKWMHREAIMTIGACGSESDVARLQPLKKRTDYSNALMYAFGSAGMEIEWLCAKCRENLRKNEDVGDSLRALGLAFSKTSPRLHWAAAAQTAAALFELVRSGALGNEQDLAIVDLAIICSQAPDPGTPLVRSVKHFIRETPSLQTDDGAVAETASTSADEQIERAVGGSGSEQRSQNTTGDDAERETASSSISEERKLARQLLKGDPLTDLEERHLLRILMDHSANWPILRTKS